MCSVCHFCPILTKTVLSPRMLTKISNIEFHEIRPVGSTCFIRRTDEQTLRIIKIGRVKSNTTCGYFIAKELSKNLKIKIYSTIILPVICMGVKLGH
jgi:hypothetical protein